MNKKFVRVAILSILFAISFSFLACNDTDKSGSNNKKTFTNLLLIGSAPFIPGPVVDYSGKEQQGKGRLLTAQQMWDLPLSYCTIYMQQFLAFSKATLDQYPNLTPKYAMKYYMITYETTNWDGAIVTASGALWVPGRTDALSIVSFSHGTNISTDQENSRTLIGMFATLGHLAIGPDYIGYGASGNIDHPYIHPSTLASTNIDMIRASKKFAEYNSIQLNGKLFLTGISEGGYAAMATVREIEKNYALEHPITAAAPISGSYDLTGTSKFYIEPNHLSTQGQLNYLVFIMPVYNIIYNWKRPLSDFFKEPYATWFTEHRYPRDDWKTIFDAMPANTSDLLTDSFIQNYSGSGETELKALFEQNNTYKFVPATYVRMYGANGDTHVPIANAQTALQYFTEHGAQHVSMETVNGDHEDTFVPLLARAVDWFATF